jgi:uroporphyrinogen decarboxylase
MNATERMEAALALRPVDRVPNAPFYEAPVCRYFGSTLREALLEPEAMLRAHQEGLARFDFDWVMVGMGLIGGIIPEALGCRINYPEEAFPQILRTAVRSADDLAQIGRAKLFTDRMRRFLEGVRRLSDILKGSVPIAVEFVSPFSIAARLRGTNEIMEDIYDNPDLVRRLQEVLVPVDIEIGKAFLEAGMTYIFYGADMECPLLISPQHYREFVHEPTRRVIDTLAALGARVLPHMCGDIVKMGIVDLLLEMDIDGIMPGNLTQEQVLDIRQLKTMVGERTAVFDNLNPNGPLLIGTPAEVAAETRAHLERARGMRGYLFSTAGTTSPAVPLENFEAMNREVLAFR